MGLAWFVVDVEACVFGVGDGMFFCFEDVGVMDSDNGRECEKFGFVGGNEFVEVLEGVFVVDGE